MVAAFTYTGNRVTIARPVNRMGAVMDATENGRTILDLMAKRGIRLTDSIPIDDIIDHGIDEGLSLSEIQGTLVHAGAKEWIRLDGQNVHLSETGYMLIGSANDNAEGA